MLVISVEHMKNSHLVFKVKAVLLTFMDDVLGSSNKGNSWEVYWYFNFVI